MSESTMSEFQSQYDKITDEIKTLNRKQREWVKHVEDMGFELINGEFVKQKK
tara:strand:- start:12318 stop:12473 length:156 start_codon:yes stop_codon:yes gene_type:complete